MALEAYSIYADDDKEDVLYMIQDRGIYYWDENIKLIKELDQLYLPKKNMKTIKD
jgi:rhomboid protease GluP